MAFDEVLAQRVRSLLARRKGIAEKKMFGGVGFLLGGNMAVGVWKRFLILRIGLDGYQAALADPHVKKFDITGRALRGWVMVGPDGLADDAELRRWVRRATTFATSLPAKTA